MCKLIVLNKYIYIYIFICLLNPTSSAQKGKFSMTCEGKTWKFTLDDVDNAVKFFDGLKSQKTIEVTMTTMKGNTNYFIMSDCDYIFGFVSPTSDIQWNKNYFIFAYYYSKDILGICMENCDGQKNNKIGEIVEGMDKLSDLTSLFNQKGNVTFTFSYEEETEESNNVVKIVIVAITCLLLFLFYCLLLLFL